MVGLGDIVLGHLVEQVRLGFGGVDGGQDDDREIGAGLDLSREREAVHAGHQHVDDEQVWPGVVKPAQSFVAVTGGLDVVAVCSELLGEDDEQVGVVVHDEDPRGPHAVRSGSALQHGARITAGVWRSDPRGAWHCGGSPAPPERPAPQRAHVATARAPGARFVS